MVMRTSATLLACLVLSGCAVTDAGSGPRRDLSVMKVSTGEFAPPARGYSEVTVRSLVSGTEADWLETVGARCVASAGPYAAVLTTPARLAVPDLGPDALQVSVECTQGALAGRALSGPVYRWPAGGKPGPLSRIAYGGGWWYGYQKSGPLRYPDINVGLR